MKLLPVRILTLTAVLCTLSCGTIDYAKKYPNMVANADPVTAGTIEIQLNKFLSSKVSKVESRVIFYPRLNAVALEFRYELIRHRQFWDEDSRKQFARALELYKEDYAARKLVDKYRKTRGVYGKAQGRVEWEAFKYTKTRVAHPSIEMGYRFKDKMPFFTTLMRPAKEEVTNSDNSARGESVQISMFFTRAQADELVALFDQDFLMGLLGDIHGPQSDERDEEGNLLEPYREMQ